MSGDARGQREIPVLESERLWLRGHRPEDYGNSVKLWADPEVTRYIGGRPLTGEEVWERLLRYVGHWAWLGYGPWAIEEKATGKFIGQAGYANHKRDIQPPLAEMPELGWALASDCRGKGYATEAVRAAMIWGDERFNGQRSFCIIHPENVRSMRVAEKCGFKKSGHATYKGEPTVVFIR
jgi:RimJ/RimL family protein N-acetyltransferase